MKAKLGFKMETPNLKVELKSAKTTHGVQCVMMVGPVSMLEWLADS